MNRTDYYKWKDQCFSSHLKIKGDWKYKAKSVLLELGLALVPWHP